MADVILVVLQGAEMADPLLRAGLQLAELVGGARVVALAVRAPMEAINMFPEGVLTEEAADLLQSADQDRIQGIEHAFRAWEEQARPTMPVVFVDADGPTELVIEERGGRADYIIIAQPENEDDRPARQAFHAALFETERPVLVVPRRPAREFGRKVAIAWRDDRRTTKAVLAALRCMHQVEQVHVLAGLRDLDAQRALPEVIEEHAVAAKLCRMPLGTGEFGAALLRQAHALDADMLVMGAYVHNPIRRLILGGVTRYMLANADIPVLMSY
jgi:nucleotide-binding universal stress UspA family protein